MKYGAFDGDSGSIVLEQFQHYLPKKNKTLCDLKARMKPAAAEEVRSWVGEERSKFEASSKGTRGYDCWFDKDWLNV